MNVIDSENRVTVFILCTSSQVGVNKADFDSRNVNIAGSIIHYYSEQSVLNE